MKPETDKKRVLWGIKGGTMPRFIFSAFVPVIKKSLEAIAGAWFFVFCRRPRIGLKTAFLAARSFVLAVEDSSCAIANRFYAGYRFFWKYAKFLLFLRNPPLTKGSPRGEAAGRRGGGRKHEPQT